ncbi:MAG: hypothetical protein ACKVW3_15615 [Phycisphaerales bacterium]
MSFKRFQCVAWAGAAGLSLGAAEAQWDYKKWTAAFSNPSWQFSNTSAAGTITTTSNTAFTPAFGAWGVPTAITTNNIFPTELDCHGIGSLGGSLDLNFSNGYGWGTGGRLFIGNIHNFYEYTISAWDFSNNQIDVNTWLTVNEWQATAPGSAGYFSTSSTTRGAVGLSSRFFVFDTTVNKNFGQGGVVLIDGLTNVKRLRLTLSNSALMPNAQQSDFILFNVGTPVPAPASAAVLCGAGVIVLRRRRR